jgi:hypothetical protein
MSIKRSPDYKGKLDRHRSTQHLLAGACANYLSDKYASASSTSPSPIPIVARDPSYNLKDLHLLSRMSPPITIVSNPYQYLSITPNSLLIVIGIPTFIPIHEIAADICFPGGPAAIICNEIWEHPWHKDGQMTCLDQRTPRVDRMLNQYDVQWLGKDLEHDGTAISKFEEDVNNWAQDQFLYARRENF